jgi:hypothetical protein
MAVTVGSASWRDQHPRATAIDCCVSPLIPHPVPFVVLSPGSPRTARARFLRRWATLQNRREVGKLRGTLVAKPIDFFRLPARGGAQIVGLESGARPCLRPPV